MKRIFMVLVWAGLSLAACQNRKDVRCEQDSNCDLFTGGVCAAASTGARWCAYPAPDCPSGFRFSDDDVGDSVGGTCLARALHMLTVSLGGNGAGQVISSPAGIDCPGTCSAAFDEGQEVSLSQETSTSIFLGWNEVCNDGTTCSITLNNDQTVNARFGIPGSSRWLSQLRATEKAWIFSAAALSNHDIVVVGDFTGTIATGDNTNAVASGFVARLRADDGSIVWLKTINATVASGVRFVGIDASDDIFLGGSFSGTITLGDTNVQSAGGSDVYVMKVSGKDGTTIWHRAFGSADEDYISGLGVSPAGDVTITGYFNGTISPGGPPLQGGWATYLIRYTNDAGLVAWSKAITGTNTTLGEYPAGLAIDGAGNAIIIGSFSGTVDFGGGPRTAPNGESFLAKYAGENGAYIVDKILGAAYAKNITADAAGSMYLNGTFSGSTSIDGRPLTSAGGEDIFALKYSPAGQLQWVQSFGNTLNDSTNALAIDAEGQLVFTTLFDGTVTYGGENLASAGSSDIAVVRIRASNGTYLSSLRIGGPGSEEATAITSSSAGIFIGGLFSNTTDFAGQSLSASGTSDAFALQLLPYLDH